MATSSGERLPVFDALGKAREKTVSAISSLTCRERAELFRERAREMRQLLASEPAWGSEEEMIAEMAEFRRANVCQSFSSRSS